MGCLNGCMGIFDVSTLAACPKLHLLHLHACMALQRIPGIQTLHTLNLGWCGRLRDITPLANCATIHTLVLDNCGNIEDISPLGTLEKLHKLGLARCKITDVSPLTTAPAL